MKGREFIQKVTWVYHVSFSRFFVMKEIGKIVNVNQTSTSSPVILRMCWMKLWTIKAENLKIYESTKSEKENRIDPCKIIKNLCVRENLQPSSSGVYFFQLFSKHSISLRHWKIESNEVKLLQENEDISSFYTVNFLLHSFTSCWMLQREFNVIPTLSPGIGGDWECIRLKSDKQRRRLCADNFIFILSLEKSRISFMSFFTHLVVELGFSWNHYPFNLI